MAKGIGGSEFYPVGGLRVMPISLSISEKVYYILFGCYKRNHHGVEWSINWKKIDAYP